MDKLEQNMNHHACQRKNAKARAATPVAPRTPCTTIRLAPLAFDELLAWALALDWTAVVVTKGALEAPVPLLLAAGVVGAAVPAEDAPLINPMMVALNAPVMPVILFTRVNFRVGAR
jgi:hypothetical protein